MFFCLPLLPVTLFSHLVRGMIITHAGPYTTFESLRDLYEGLEPNLFIYLLQGTNINEHGHVNDKLISFCSPQQVDGIYNKKYIKNPHKSKSTPRDQTT